MTGLVVAALSIGGLGLLQACYLECDLAPYPIRSGTFAPHYGFPEPPLAFAWKAEGLQLHIDMDQQLLVVEYPNEGRLVRETYRIIQPAEPLIVE